MPLFTDPSVHGFSCITVHHCMQLSLHSGISSPQLFFAEFCCFCLCCRLEASASPCRESFPHPTQSSLFTCVLMCKGQLMQGQEDRHEAFRFLQTPVTSDLTMEWREENYPLAAAKNGPATPAKSPSCLLLSCWNSFPLAAPEILPALGSWSKGVTSD